MSIFNAPYFPDGNPIENVFALVKNHFKRKKLNKLLDGRYIDQQALIADSFGAVTTELC